MAREEDTLHEAAVHMRDRNVGTLIVVDRADRLTGIITDRDLVVRGLADGHSLADMTVKNVMTAQPVVVSEDTSVEVALELMKEGAFRRLPVTGEDGDCLKVIAAPATSMAAA